ncbi:hypothetical protein DFH07DRAFT_828990 [Mycena maculata]|uniref:Uncharacterized protein n=1 Tax=Mycena maculata TaxID=230809 RepID=A0AAD7ISL0_9AGAR|nr:hypothetical protein DFH07DRAFT_828990 [Mycena maculata]
MTDTSTGCLDVLLKCMNLETAAVSTTSSGIISEHPITILPHLRSLLFVMDWEKVEGDDYAERFFLPLELPALAGLQLFLQSRPLSSAYFLQFLLRSPDLRSLDLTLSDICSEDLIDVLRCTPALTYLRLCLCSCCIENSSLRGFSTARTIHWDSINGDFAEASLESMLRSRWWPVGQPPSSGSSQLCQQIARLKDVHISCARPSLRGLGRSMKKYTAGEICIW